MKSKIAVISPSSNLTAQIQKEVETRHLEFIIMQGSTKDAVNEGEELILNGVKVFISRGNTATILRNRFDVPVVDIKHTFFDCYNAYKNAKQYSDKIAFLATSEGFELILQKSIEFMSGAIIIPVNPLDGDAVIDEKLKQLTDDGIEVAIGGLSLEKQVKALGIKYIMTESNSISLNESIEEALHLLKIEVEREERKLELENKYEMINSIFNCASEGILSIDRKGLITNINLNARRILGKISEGEYIYKILPIEKFMDALETGCSVAGEIVNCGKVSLVVNIEPIKVGSETTGAVVTLQQSKQIQAIEQKIRHIMLDKGHVSDKTFDDIIGDSEKIRLTKELAKKYAAVDSTVLILGETGTGKELFAQSIHNSSKRSSAPFVAINCAAFPPSILESELFGYVKGAFTGARNEGKAGIFEIAHCGTIFLDEISETPLDVQLKLLRVIQERKIIRIGDDKIIPIDVRIITASNKDLQQQMKLGLFRADFYYRICVLELKIPPLRQRREDIPALIRYFIEKSNMHIKGITNKAIDMLVSIEWNGNIRQLSNTIERLMVICDSDIINSDMIKEAIGVSDEAESEKKDDLQSVSESCNYPQPDNSTLNHGLTERELIKQVLQETRGNRELAAKRLGISTITLWRKIKKINSVDEHYLGLVKYGKITQ